MRRHQHYWLETGIPRILVSLNGKYRYDCSICGKQKFFGSAPLNPIVPSAWEVYNNEVARGNAHLVMSPPMIFRDEPDYIEGERYAKLVKGEL